MLLYSSISCPNAVAFLFIILTISTQISLHNCAAIIDLYLKRLEFWQLPGFHDGSLVNGADQDWRLDVLLAFGKSVYTMKVGIGGYSLQQLDMLLNFAGDLPSPLAGSLSFVANVGCADQIPCQCKDTFNHTLSQSFRPRTDVELHTKFGSGNGIELGIRLNGFHGSDRIKFTDRLGGFFSIRDQWIAQAETILGPLFNRLPFDGMFSLGWHSPLFQQQKIQNFQIMLGTNAGHLVLDYNEQDTRYCQKTTAWIQMLDESLEGKGKSSGPSAVKGKDDVDNEKGEFIPTMEAFKFQIKAVNLKIPDEPDFADNTPRNVLLNQNSPFLQGPISKVREMAKRVGAVQKRLGFYGHRLYVIPCKQQYGPLAFTTAGGQQRLELSNIQLNIVLPSPLLPDGECLWGIQENIQIDNGNDNNVDDGNYWVFGRPIFDKFCVNVDMAGRLIGFPRKSTTTGSKYRC